MRERHGMHKIPEYQAWADMKGRCLNKRHPWYSSYGGRGISVCERWIKFTNFISDMGRRPPSTTLGRINNDGNYEPENCAWQTHAEQQNNTRYVRFVEFNGERLSQSAWCRRFGMCQATLQYRLYKLKWSPEKALTYPLADRGGRMAPGAKKSGHCTAL